MNYFKKNDNGLVSIHTSTSKNTYDLNKTDNLKILI